MQNIIEWSIVPDQVSELCSVLKESLQVNIFIYLKGS